jgi:hypothetical protein
MNRQGRPLTSLARLLISVSCLLIASAGAQSNPYERTFPQSKSTVEKALRTMQAQLAGRLPALEGFAQAASHPLDRYERGYYQASVQVSANPSGGSLVRVNTKVTAWYADPAASTNAGYQLLVSNGRIETDLLDQLSQLLAKDPANLKNEPGTAEMPHAPRAGSEPVAPAAPTEPSASSSKFSSSLSQSLESQEHASFRPTKPDDSEKTDSALEAEFDSLQDILKNQAHPRNLVAVKKSGTPVVSTPSLTAKPQFLASMHDEFELLNFNQDWVHVRISGLSRGWIWRNAVEMPDGIPDTQASAASALTPAADLFHVVREETAPFPGDWEPLRSKNVKIVSVQKIDENTKTAGPRDRLEYAKFLLEKDYAELAKGSQELAGIVVIFDSSDGGMIAATMSSLQQWRAGTLSDSALWHKCFFDPPETFDAVAPAGSQ